MPASPTAASSCSSTLGTLALQAVSNNAHPMQLPARQLPLPRAAPPAGRSSQPGLVAPLCAGMGLCHAAVGEYKPAIDALRQALFINPRLSALHHHIRQLEQAIADQEQ